MPGMLYALAAVIGIGTVLLQVGYLSWAMSLFLAHRGELFLLAGLLLVSFGLGFQAVRWTKLPAARLVTWAAMVVGGMPIVVFMLIREAPWTYPETQIVGVGQLVGFLGGWFGTKSPGATGQPSVHL